MIGETISHYQILEKIGEGGMGVVYKALDKNLNRIVALKFLRSTAFGDEQHKRRFIREAQVAAALDHTNICTVYEIEEEKDQIFIAMAFAEGRTLRERIKSGKLHVEEVLDISIQIAQGLEAAHEKGIVHRDIKSSNIMITKDERVRVMDFGLAKMSGGSDITRTKTTMGTTLYMSPEQARGEAIDHRSDIWSFGVCIYEMVTGELPFKGDYPQSIIYAIMNRNPEPLSVLEPEIPVRLEHIVDKALAKNPDDRFRHIGEMLLQLRSIRKEVRTGVRDEAHVPAGDGPSIAVLPFVDMSPQKDQEFFCDGTAEEIINALTKVDELHVVSRTSSFSFKGQTEDIREVGKKLGVRTVLEGSVRKAGNRLRITAQLIDVNSGYHLWSERYDRDLEDVFAIQDEIADNIVKALEIELTDKEKRAMEKTATIDIQAYEYYLRGRQYFYQTKRKNLDLAREMYQKAIQCDSNYALAHAGIANCYSYMFMYYDKSHQNLDQAMAASGRALELDPGLAEGHAARGLAVSLNKHYDEAEREFERAMELNPKLFEAYYFYARTLFVQGKKEKAIEYFERATLVDPDDFQSEMLRGFVLKAMGRRAEAAEAYEQCLKKVKKHVELNPEDARAVYCGSAAYVDMGNREKGLEWLKRSLSLSPDDPYILYGAVCTFCTLGELEEAIQYFEETVKSGFAHKEWIENDTDLDPIRDHPRYAEIMKMLE